MQLDIHAINKLSETKEISCNRIQSQVYLNYVECRRNSLNKKKRPNITHVTEQAIRKTHLKVHGKKTRKFPLSYVQRKLVYFAMTRELILRKIRLRNILLYGIFCWLFLAPLGAVSC